MNYFEVIKIIMCGYIVWCSICAIAYFILAILTISKLNDRRIVCKNRLSEKLGKYLGKIFRSIFYVAILIAVLKYTFK